MKKNLKRFQIAGSLILAIMIILAVVAIFGLSGTVKELKDEMISETPTAVLASAGVKDHESIDVPVLYFDQRADGCVNLFDAGLRNELLKRQFEWGLCGYDKKEIETGLVDFYLGDDGYPVGVGGQLTSNRGLKNMDRWFSEIEGKSKKVIDTLALDYVETEMKFRYENEEFYPLDQVSFSDGDFANVDGHNHLFTMSLAVPFKVLGSGEESLNIEADDDTFVFIDDKLVIDMGGIHDAVNGGFWINEAGEVYSGVNGEEKAFTGVSLKVGDNAIIRIFHADRNVGESVFSMNLYGIEPMVMNSQIADGDGVQVAYDPEDPLHAAPLGVSMSTKQDNKKGYIVMATIYGAVIMAVSVGVVVFSRYLVKVK